MTGKTITNQEFEKALKNHKPIIQSVLNKYSYLINADDLYSCGLISLWKSLQKYDANKGAKFSTYLYNMVHFECKTFLRDEFKHQQHEYIDYSNESDILHIEIQDLIGNLSPENFFLIKSKYFDHMSLREIADILNISCESVRLKLKKILDYLKTDLVTT